MRATLICFFFIIISLSASAQVPNEISGKVLDENQQPIQGATIQVIQSEIGTITDQYGNFTLNGLTTQQVTLRVRFLGYKVMDTLVSVGSLELSFELAPDTDVLESVEVTGDFQDSNTINAQKISPNTARTAPSAFKDFNQLLATLPGVSTNNELSSAYSVRGGNFDENLVYVNEMPIYRPFLANSGRQEGLSFVNPDLVADVNFYSGGWEAKYGDKLSSSLNITYDQPEQTRGGIEVGLLGGSGYVGGTGKGGRFSYIAGIRHRDSQYLLNSLEIDGQYFPRFTDIQSLMTFDLTKSGESLQKRTTLQWLTSYSRNRYRTIPTSRVTEFGSVTRNLRIQTAFDGRELLIYDTWQSGFNFMHWITSRLRSSLIVSSVYTQEQEDYEVEGAYRLCDIDNNPSSDAFTECVITRGIGTQFDYGRNDLTALLTTVENRYEYLPGDQWKMDLGFGIRNQQILDEINEYSFKDSADFVEVTNTVFNELNLNNNHYFAYLQAHLFSSDSIHELNAGIRLNYWDQTGQLLTSPRLLYRVRISERRPTFGHFSIGSYQQHPFYRELRNSEGLIQSGVRAQKSIHIISGLDRFMTIWGRQFVFSLQAYYKFLDDIIPYDVDNLRLRYLSTNAGVGFARGLDMRMNGEFISGTQSWFSLSILQTEENLDFDDRGNIRRPLDQRVNLGIFFEDHLPGDPSLRVYLNMNFGSGYPFGPPGDLPLRNVFSGDEYYRADLGLTKLIKMNNRAQLGLRLEVLNVLGADNTLSYTWIEDVNGTSFAIPNSLSARFFNFKISMDF